MSDEPTEISNSEPASIPVNPATEETPIPPQPSPEEATAGEAEIVEEETRKDNGNVPETTTSHK